MQTSCIYCFLFPTRNIVHFVRVSKGTFIVYKRVQGLDYKNLQVDHLLHFFYPLLRNFLTDGRPAILLTSHNFTLQAKSVGVI